MRVEPITSVPRSLDDGKVDGSSQKTTKVDTHLKKWKIFAKFLFVALLASLVVIIVLAILLACKSDDVISESSTDQTENQPSKFCGMKRFSVLLLL